MSRQLQYFGRCTDKRNRRLSKLLFKCFGVPAALIWLAMLLQGCTQPPALPLAGPDPANPSSQVASAGYASTVAPYHSRRPVEPTPWRQQNDQVAPSPKPKQ